MVSDRSIAVNKLIKKICFAFVTIVLTTFIIAGLIWFYLEAVKRDYIMIPGFVLRRFKPIKIYLHNEKIHKLAALASKDEEQGVFETISDSSDRVFLSRKEFDVVEMYGQTRYRYKPYLRKMAFGVQAEGRIWEFEMLENEEALRFSSQLKTLAVKIASFDQNGFRKTDFNLDSKCKETILFVGDSFTEGLFVGDRETFVNHFGHLINAEREDLICPINGGVNGYSALEESFVIENNFEKFRYHTVFLMHFPNDIYSDCSKVIYNSAEGFETGWRENFFYMNKIAQFCKLHGITLIVVAIHPNVQLNTPATKRNYQDRLKAFCDESKIYFIDLFEDFKK